MQRAERAVFAPGEAREDWAILARGQRSGKPLAFDSFDQLRAPMVDEYPQLAREGLIDLDWAPPKLGQGRRPIRYPIRDFYLTNAICRAARRCSAARKS